MARPPSGDLHGHWAERGGYVVCPPVEWSMLCRRHGVFGYGCPLCSYVSDRMYHARMHYERIHVARGKVMERKRKYSTWMGGDAAECADDVESAFDVCRLVYSPGSVFLCRSCDYVCSKLEEAGGHLAEAHPTGPRRGKATPWSRGDGSGDAKKTKPLQQPKKPRPAPVAAARAPRPLAGLVDLPAQALSDSAAHADRIGFGSELELDDAPALDDGGVGLPMFCPDETTGIYSMALSPDDEPGTPDAPGTAGPGTPDAPGERGLFTIHEMSSTLPHYTPPAGGLGLGCRGGGGGGGADSASFMRRHARRVQREGGGVDYDMDCGVSVSTGPSGSGFRVCVGGRGVDAAAGARTRSQPHPSPGELRDLVEAGGGRALGVHSGPRLVDGLPNRDTNWRCARPAPCARGGRCGVPRRLTRSRRHAGATCSGGPS